MVGPPSRGPTLFRQNSAEDLVTKIGAFFTARAAKPLREQWPLLSSSSPVVASAYCAFSVISMQENAGNALLKIPLGLREFYTRSTSFSTPRWSLALQVPTEFSKGSESQYGFRNFSSDRRFPALSCRSCRCVYLCDRKQPMLTDCTLYQLYGTPRCGALT